jgi:cobalamin 5'-phosphate synthase/cobalamin synthase
LNDRSGPWWAPVAAAVGFLTILPVPARAAHAVALGRSAAWFPLVGAALGALLGGAGWLLDGVLPPGPVAALLLVLGAVITGGLHLDGLMDAADGVLGGAVGGRSRERRLEIMRDSRVGAFGVLAGALALLLQFACLAELDGGDRFFALVAALAASRWAVVVAIVAFPAARPDGLAAGTRAAVDRRPLVVATALAVLVLLAAGPLGPAVLAVAALVAVAGGRWLAARLGGLTGDTYGALAVVAETGTLIVAVALLASGEA